jgi:hypothetical protein
MGLTPNSGGNSSLYALSLIFSRILKGSSAKDISLDFSNQEIILFASVTKQNLSVSILLPSDLYYWQLDTSH